MAEFTTEKGRPVIINPQHVVAVSPAYDQHETPVIGLAAVLTNLAPPNVPGAGSIVINVKGDYRDVAFQLGLRETGKPTLEV